MHLWNTHRFIITLFDKFLSCHFMLSSIDYHWYQLNWHLPHNEAKNLKDKSQSTSKEKKRKKKTLKKLTLMCSFSFEHEAASFCLLVVSTIKHNFYQKSSVKGIGVPIPLQKQKLIKSFSLKYYNWKIKIKLDL